VTMTINDSLMQKALKAQDELRAEMQNIKQTDPLSNHGWEVASAALRARDSAQARMMEANKRAEAFKLDLAQARETIARLERDFADSEAMVDMMSRTLKRLARKGEV